MEVDLEDKIVECFKDCALVFDDTFDSKHNLRDPLFSRVKMK